MATGTAAGLGGLAGAIYGPLGSSVGTAVGGMAGGLLSAIPQLVVSDAEKENKRRIAELKRMQELGTLGLTEAEKQHLYGSATSQIQGQLRTAGQVARQAGAAGMATGAGTELLRQGQAAGTQAELAAGVAQNVEGQNLARKRELEDEITGREQAASQMKTDRLSAITGILTGGLASGTEALTAEQTYQGKTISHQDLKIAASALGPNVTEEEAALFLQDAAANPAYSEYISLLTKAGS